MDDDSLHYTSPNHPYHLMTAINQLRQKQVLCDILLKVGEYQIPVHKLMLSVCTPYFRNLTDPKTESSDVVEVHLPGLDGESVQQIIEFFYTSAISVTEATVWELLPAACTLQVEEVQNLCSDYLSQHIQLENCLRIHKLAARYLCSSLLKEATDYIKSNFEKILEEESFLDMTVDNMLSELRRLSDTGLSEEQVLHGIKCWLIHCLDERQSFGLKIIKEFSSLKEKLQDFIPEEFLVETEEDKKSNIEADISSCSDKSEEEDSSEEYDQRVTSYNCENVLGKFYEKLKEELDNEGVDLKEQASIIEVRNRELQARLMGLQLLYGFVNEIAQRTQEDQSNNTRENDDSLTFNMEDFENSENDISVDNFPSGSRDSPELQFACTWPNCGRSFSSRTGLRYHMNVHKNEFPYFCEQCNKGFNRIGQYESHCNKHSGMSWECPICGAKVRTQQGRKVHEAQHKNQVYKCDVCSKMFNCKEYMQAHRRGHVNTFECPICHKKFKRKHHLVEHVRVHEKNGFKCEHCNFVTNYRQSLRRHMHGVHTTNTKPLQQTPEKIVDKKISK